MATPAKRRKAPFRTNKDYDRVTRTFLKALAVDGNVTRAAAAAKTSKQTLKEWRDKDAQFRYDWDMAVDAVADMLESEAIRRAVQGVDKVVVSGGKVVLDDNTKQPMVEKVYSDGLLTLLLKGAKPERFRENHKVEHTGTISIQISEDDAKL